jgi:arginine exporter protein ArgO
VVGVVGVIGVFGQGLLAGLAVALPLGAISVLLLHEAFTRGWRSAVAGATGVALVDLGYAVLAVTAGTLVTSLLSGHERSIRRVGAVVLVVVAGYGVVRVFDRRGAASAEGPADAAVAATSPLPTVARFVTLTVLNPLTAVYFTVLAAGLDLRGARRGLVFALGVFLGSWVWQLVLVTVGALVGERLPTRVRVGISVLGSAIVLGYAVHLALT